MPVNDTAAISSEIGVIVQACGSRPEQLVQMLWEVQDKYSYIPSAAIDLLSEQLQLPRARVEGTAGFYSFFYDTPRGQYNILFSDNITDRMLGKTELMNHLCRRLKVQAGAPRADGRVTVGATSCTGMCEQGPALLVNGYAVPRLTVEKLDTIAGLIEAGTPINEWPQDFFTVNDNIRRRDFLLDSESVSSGGLYTLKALLAKGPEAVLSEIDKAGLRGCGGAGFKTALKWKLCRETPAEERYVVCNADEGEPGTFKDRVLLQSYPDLVFEGMTLCAGIINAKKGFVYLRGEYRYMLDALNKTLDMRRAQGLLGKSILGRQGFDFDIEIHLGAGAYVCGAELALVESLEGKRGTPRNRPPFPVTHGYMNKPTVVNNVETFAFAAKIPVYGWERFAAVGTAQSKGTKLISVSGDCTAPGIYEIPFGTTIGEVLNLCGAENPQAVQISGAAGQLIPATEFHRRICFEDVSCGGSFMVFGQGRDLLDTVLNFSEFFVHESCGFCTPCRVGTTLMKNTLQKVYEGRGTLADLQEMENLGLLMRQTSHCGLGQTAANPVLDTLKKCPEIYHRHLNPNASFKPYFDLDRALQEARELTARDDAEAHL